MVLFGLVLLLIAVLIVIAAVVNGGDPASLDLQLFTIKTNVTGVFVAGAITLLLAVLGAALVAYGLRYDKQRRAQIRDLRKRASRSEERDGPSGLQPPQKSSPRPARPATDESAPTTAATTGSTGPSGSTGTSGPTGSSGSTSADVSRPDDGPDEYFETAPRDPAS
jgi:hypothetical protein